MISKARTAWPLLRVLFLALLAAGAARAAEGPVLLSEEASGSVDVGKETTLAIERVPGEITIGAGEKGQILYSSEMGNAARAPLPVALWVEEDTFRLVPPEGARVLPSVLRIWVPPAMRLSVSTSDSAIRMIEVEGSVTVKGQRNRVELVGTGGPVTVEVEEGNVTVVRSRASVTIRGRGLTATVEDAGGTLLLQMARGSATVKAARGGLDGDLDGVEIKVDGAGGACRLRLKGGRADLAGLQAGADLTLSGATLKLERSRGTFGIESDRDVSFRDLEGAVRVTAYAGAVRGSTLKGSIEVTGAGANEVQVESISNSVSVEGAGLAARLSDIGGEVTVRTSSAPVRVENAVGPLTVESEIGDVEAVRIMKLAKITSRGGAVRLSDLNGPVSVSADGAQVEVSWVSLDPGADSSITNEGGGVSVRFPLAGGCRLEAAARYGRIEAENLPGVSVTQGGAQAQGIVGRVNRPLVKIVANGNIRLAGNAAAEGDAP